MNFPRLNSRGLPQVAVGHVELDYTSVNLPNQKLKRIQRFNQTRLTPGDGALTRERDLRACAQGQR